MDEGLHACGSLALPSLDSLAGLVLFLVSSVQYLFTEILEGPSGHRCPAQSPLQSLHTAYSNNHRKELSRAVLLNLPNAVTL